MAPSSPESIGSAIRQRSRRRSWLLRAPLLVWLAFLLLQHLRDPSHRSVWSALNLALHEIGRIVFLPLPDLLAAAGGTLTELAIPLVAAALLLRRREDFGAAVALFWLSTSLLGIAAYPGDPFRGAGLLVMAGSVGLGAWILGLMATDPERERRRAPLKSGGDPLAAEDLRFRAWLEAREGEEGGGAPPGPAADPAPRPDRALESLRDTVDRDTLTPEERRLLDFLEREAE